VEKMRGILFSFISIFLTLALLSIITIYSTLTSYKYKRIGVQSRIESLQNFYQNLIRDGEKALRVISRRAMSAAVSYVITNGEGLNDSISSLRELILNGSIEGEKQPLMENSTLLDWKNSMEAISLSEGFKLSSSIENIEIKAYDSFNLLISFNFSVNITDLKGTAKISKKEKIESLVSIEGFEDPLYPLNTRGLATNVIEKSKYWGKYSSSNLTMLQEALSNSWYHPSLYGASFLDRLEGKYFVDPSKPRVSEVIGLESFVNKDELQTYGVDVYFERTNIDYLYFSGGSYSVYKISGMPESFRLDNETSINNLGHLQIYNVSELIE